MINNVTDLNNRTMVESNILKSIILSSTDDRLPSRDDILIHDYQIANSVTINSILSNYIVNLKYAWNLLDREDGSDKESYFQIVGALETSQYSLDDETRMVMEVVNGRGTFKARKMVYQASNVKLDKNVVSFHNLDSVWYGKQRNTNKETGKEYDNFVIVDGMNDFFVNPNPYGMNIFDAPIKIDGSDRESFNAYALSCSERMDFHVTMINENLFYHNVVGDGSGFSGEFSLCRYVLCMGNGLYGLEPKFDGPDKAFSSLVMHDLGKLIDNLDQDQYVAGNYYFKSCSFQVVDGITSMIIVVANSSNGVQHYLFINEDSYDSLYGLRELQSVVVDGLVVDAFSVFTNVEAVRQLDSVCIALTNYGFWDVEPNTTKYVTYSYNGGKNYALIGAYGNALKTKIVRPEFQVGTGQFKIVEYDKKFDKVSNHNGTEYWICNDVSYLNAIKSPSGTQHFFVGGTDSFAVYNATTTEPAYIVPYLKYEQFKELLFSSSDLLNEFLDYFYEQSVHSRTTDSANPYGEYYLKQNHASFRHTLNILMDAKGEFNNLKYSATDVDLVQKFASILQLVQSGKTPAQYSSWNLHAYCANLATELNTVQPISWLIKTPSGTTAENYLKQRMDAYFIANEYDGQIDAIQRSIVDGLVSEHSLLGHFQEYFMEHVGSHIASCPSGGITNNGNWVDIVSSVRDLIRSQVLTALVLKDGTYDGIQSYLHHHTAYFNKPEIRSIMSTEAVKTQMTLAVKSAPMFNDSHTYLQMKGVVENSAELAKLFSLSYNVDFAKKSNLMAGTKVNLDWGYIKGFLFPSATGNEIPELEIIRAFVRTQIYRPLYFNATGYTTKFSSNTSQYVCETYKSYVNHDGVTHDLVFSSETTWEINRNASGLNPSGAGYTISNSAFQPSRNVLSYQVNYNPISIENDKFVYQDVEHYVKRNSSGKIIKVLYNEFQKEIQSTCKNVSIDESGKFVLNGKAYQIELVNGVASRVSVDSATNQFKDDELEYKCDVVNDIFKIDGIWYALEKIGGEYSGLSYAGVDDNKLVSVSVDVSSATCFISNRNLKFKFSGSPQWNRVVAVLDYETMVMDSVKREHCLFDDLYGSRYTVPAEASYDWFLANHIFSNIAGGANGKNHKVNRLGNGVLFTGALGYSNFTCRLNLVHEVFGGDVVSKCVLKKQIEGIPETQHQLGVLYDRNLNLVQGKTLRGHLDASGLFVSNANEDVFIMIDPKGKKNNTNLVKIAKATWQNNLSIVNNVGTISEADEETGIQRTDFGSEPGYPRYLTLKWIETTKSNNVVYNWYQVNVNADGSGKYKVRQSGDIVHVFANGVRYAINMKTKTISKLNFVEMPASTIDFSTQYTFEQLRNNLLNNIKQYMMNQIVQCMVDNGSLSSIQFNPKLYMTDGSGLFLDMFPDDVSLSNFMVVNNYTSTERSECKKFLEVFKNNLFDIDDSNIYYGRAYQYLAGKIQNAFGNRNSFAVLDINTITPELVSSADTFRYEVRFDLHLMQNKDLMKRYDYNYQKKWIVGDLLVKNMRCKVTFTPVYTARTTSVAGSMKYTARYVVQAGSYTVEYSQIIYCIDEKVKKKSIPTQTKTGVAIPEISYSDGITHALSDITNETIANKIENIFTNEKVISQFIAINNQLGNVRLVVDTESKKNLTYDGDTWTDGHVWNLNEQIPSSLPGRLVYVNRGNVLVDGDIYDVVAVEEGGVMKDKYIEQHSGPGRFELVPMDVHKHDENSLPPTITDYNSTAPNSTGNITSKCVAQGGEIISALEVQRFFALDHIGNVYFLRLKTNAYNFLFPTYSGSTFGVRLSGAGSVAHLNEFAKSISKEVLLQGETTNTHWFYQKLEATLQPSQSRIVLTKSKVKQSKNDLSTTTVSGTSTTTYVPYSTTVNCLLLTPENSEPYIATVGNSLTPGSAFKWNFTSDEVETMNAWLQNDAQPQLTMNSTIDFTGYYEETISNEIGLNDEEEGVSGVPDEESSETVTSGWFGIEGKLRISVTFAKTSSGEPTILTAVVNGSSTAAENNCRTLGGIPSIPSDDVFGNNCYETTLYTLVRDARTADDIEQEKAPIWVNLTSGQSEALVDPQIDFDMVSEVDETEQAEVAEGEEPPPPPEQEARLQSVKITFRVNARVTEQILALAPANGQRYLQQNYLVGNSGGYYVTGTFLMTDFAGYSVGNLNYGYVDYPMNLAELTAGNTFADINFKTTYFKLNPSRTGFASNGLYCPFSIDVLGPEEATDKPGDIYNRFYEVAIDVTADHSNISTSPEQYSYGKFWMDKAGTLKSINQPPTSPETYKKLIFATNASGNPTSYEDTAVPEQIRETLWKLVGERCKLDDDYFNSVLVQLKQFLQIVFDELQSAITLANILDICNFGYDKKVTFAQHTGNWNDTSDTGGLFGYQRSETTYTTCRDNFNNYLKGEFKGDFSSLKDVDDVLLYDDPNSNAGDKNKRRDYNHILLPYATLKSKVELPTGLTWNDNKLLTVLNRLRDSILRQICQNVGNPDLSLIDDVFSEGNRESVRYISAVELDITGNILEMFVANGYCNLLYQIGGGVKWNRFVSSSTSTNALLDRKSENELDFTYETTMMEVNGITNSNWIYRFGNRDLGTTSTISDQFFIHCRDDEKGDAWYHSEIGGYLYADDPIVDMAYEQHGNSTYVLFSGDNYLYRFDNLEQLKDFDGFVLLQKDNATMKIETRHSTKITDKQPQWNWIFIDYANPATWTIDLYGKMGTQNDQETWSNSPGSASYHFGQYNTVMFGDTLFDNNQLKFQNISKNKEMFDILDIYEVDGNYYGMFQDDTDGMDEGIFSVFKSGLENEVVQKLPYQITNSNFYRSLDDLYSLFVVQRVPNGTDSYKTIIREISVPDSELYRERTIDIEDIIPRPSGVTEPLEVKDLIMSQFRPMDSKTSFFVLSNWGFHKVGYTNRFRRVSVDTLDELRSGLWYSLSNTIIKKHVKEKHESEEQTEYFDQVAQKINQFSDDFDMFSLIPAEFGETQDVGVIPSGQIDDSDRDSDHRADSVLMSTDVLQTQGMVAQTDTNPGIITCAVSNPDTNYGSNTSVMKSQRNPAIEGTGFYDYIYDEDGNVLMDLYQIPFIYQVNSNNTYDLYINVPTTRTKYLNRIAGTLKPDMTTQVLPEDVRARKNFVNQSIPNNLNESTTRLRVYIDRKYISVGNIELVEISGNSIPLQIYRDTVNNGLYDSIALESRWDGEVVELKDSTKDMNKVMLEFECYGTDSQSIHIQGKTLVNRALDDGTYIFG